MNDSMSLGDGDSMEVVSDREYESNFDDSDAEISQTSDRSRHDNNYNNNYNNCGGEPQGVGDLYAASAPRAAAYRSPLAQQVLLQHQQQHQQQQQQQQQQQLAAAAQKFKLDFSAAASGTENAGLQQQLPPGVGPVNSMNPLRKHHSGGLMINGASPQSALATEKQRAMLLKNQVKELRHQRAANASKTAPVPPVGRNSAAIKAKVFDLPF